MLLKKLLKFSSSEAYTVNIHRNGMKIISYKYFIPAVILFLTGSFFLGDANAQDTTTYSYKTNYEILSDLLTKSLNKIEDRIITAGKEKTYLLSFNEQSIGNKETKSFFQSLISQRFRDYKILSDNSLNFDHKIIISSPVLSVTYTGLKTKGLIGDKLVKRVCKVSYLCTVENTITDDTRSFRYDESYTDEIPVDRIPYIEDTHFKFTRSDLPHESTFSKILLPTAILLSTAAAIVLFFTIRK